MPRRLACLLAAACLLLASAAPSRAVVEIDITQGNLRPIPIAIPQFLGGGPDASQRAAEIADIVAADLERSGLFKPIDRTAFLERIANIDTAPRFRDWRVVNAEALVVGQVTDAGGGQLKAQFRLWDVFAGRELKAETFSTGAENWRRIGHLIADVIYERLTGERGYFDSRVAFIEESGPKDKRGKRLAIMDQDGQNLRYLTRGDTLVLTPRFSPNNREITYTSYQAGRPAVLRLDLASGRQEVVGNFPGMTFAPRFSPSGQAIVMSLQQEGASNLFEMDLQSRQMRRLTDDKSIDTGPCYSPTAGKSSSNRIAAAGSSSTS